MYGSPTWIDYFDEITRAEKRIHGSGSGGSKKAGKVINLEKL